MNENLIRRGGGLAFLSDVNFDLINTYQVIQRDPEPLIRRLQVHAQNHNSDYYYHIRSQHQLDDRIEIAARLIYLNKTCYNGLWRVNSKGEFNVPDWQLRRNRRSASRRELACLPYRLCRALRCPVAGLHSNSM